LAIVKVPLERELPQHNCAIEQWLLCKSPNEQMSRTPVLEKDNLNNMKQSKISKEGGRSKNVKIIL